MTARITDTDVYKELDDIFKKDKDYDFNVCIKCQEKNKDIPCVEDCKYLKEMKKKGDEK